MRYIDRHIEQALRKADIGFKAVLVTGARQTGKSTLLKHYYNDNVYVTFDNPIVREETKREPGLFFLNNKPPILLDEVQYISELFSYIKIECDNLSQNGMIHLTGSQQFELMKNVSESLAGRIAILELSTLSLREIREELFFKPFIPNREYIADRESTVKSIDRNIWDIIHRGSYPALIDAELDWEMFYSSYVATYIDRDISDLMRIKDKLKFSRFMVSMSARTGQLLNYSTVAEQVEVSVATVKEWTSLLQASGIIYLLQPYSNSALSRAIKTPKLYFRDTGLVCFLTKHQTPQMAEHGAMAGALFETFVVSEILKSFTNAGKDPNMYVSYYRGKDKGRSGNGKEAEIDIIIDDGQMLYPVEIKMSANPKLSMANAFDVTEKISNRKRGVGTILCMYDQPLWLSENTVSLPMWYV